MPSAISPEPDPTEPPGRRLTLLDLMILIAAVGFMLLVPRAFRALTSIRDEATRLALSLHSWMTMAEAMMILGSATLVVLLSVSPRASGTGRFRSTGAVAMLAALLTFLVSFSQSSLILVYYRMNTGLEFWAYNLITLPIRQTGSNAIFAILGGWLTLKILGHFRPARDWLGRSCLLLGWIWILWGVSKPFLAGRFAW